MSLELVRETIRVNQVLEEDSTQVAVENDIIVPDVKPDIARILMFDGDVSVNNAEAVQDKMLVNGTVRFKILYVADEPEQSIKSINTSTNFSSSLNISGTRQGMSCRAKCNIEHIDYNVLNGRKISVKTIISTQGKVTDQVEQEVVHDLRGTQGIQVLKNTANVNSYIGENESNCTVKEKLEVPSGKPTIKEILRNDVSIRGKDFKISDNKIIVKGDLNISMLYTSDDQEQSIHFMEHEVPFTQFLDLQGVTEDCECEVEYRIVDSQFDEAEDSDGELRVVDSEIQLNLYATAFNRRSIEVIEDAFTPNSRLNLEKKPFKVEETVGESKAQVTIKDVISIDEDSPEIAEVFNILCKPSLSECSIVDDRVVIEGVANNNILYLAANSEQPVSCHKEEIPFRQGIELKGVASGMKCDATLDVEHCTYSMLSSKEVEIRQVIGVTVKVLNEATVPLISRVTEQPLDERGLAAQPSITIYFSQPGDNLWRIAKKYYTTIDDLKAINSLTENDVISPGRQIIIPRRIS